MDTIITYSGDTEKVKTACEICGSSGVQYTDKHGEVICTTCGTPYQWHEGAKVFTPPPMNIKDEYKPLLKQYWNETGRHMGLGSYLGKYPYPENRNAFFDWLDQQFDEEE